jgi:hypothetical protein
MPLGARSAAEPRSPPKEAEERTASGAVVGGSAAGRQGLQGAGSSQSPKRSGSWRVLPGGKSGEGEPKLRRAGSERLQDDPPPRTNVIPKSATLDAPAVTAEQWNRARKAAMERFKGSAEEERTLRGWLATLRSRRGLAKDKRILVLVGGNKTVRKTLAERGFEEVPDKEGDGTAFELKWTLSHYDINFDALLPCQLANHFPNSGCELGAKVGMHRNLRALRWFDRVGAPAPSSLLSSPLLLSLPLPSLLLSPPSPSAALFRRSHACALLCWACGASAARGAHSSQCIRCASRCARRAQRSREPTTHASR